MLGCSKRTLLSRENYKHPHTRTRARILRVRVCILAATSAGLRAIWYLEAPYQAETAGSESVKMQQ